MKQHRSLAAIAEDIRKIADWIEQPAGAQLHALADEIDASNKGIRELAEQLDEPFTGQFKTDLLAIARVNGDA